MEDIFKKIAIFEREMAEEEIMFLSKMDHLNYQTDMMALQVQELHLLKDLYESSLGSTETATSHVRQPGIYSSVSVPNVISRYTMDHHHQNLDVGRRSSYSVTDLYDCRQRSTSFADTTGTHVISSLIGAKSIVFDRNETVDSLATTHSEHSSSMQPVTSSVSEAVIHQDKTDTTLAISSKLLNIQTTTNENVSHEPASLEQSDVLSSPVKSHSRTVNNIQQAVNEPPFAQKNCAEETVPKTVHMEPFASEEESKKINIVQKSSDEMVKTTEERKNELIVENTTNGEYETSPETLNEENLSPNKLPVGNISETAFSSDQNIFSENSDDSGRNEMGISSYEAYRNMVAGNTFPQQKRRVEIDSESEDDVEKAMMMAVEVPLQTSAKVPSKSDEKPITSQNESKEVPQKKVTIVSPEKKMNTKKGFGINASNPRKPKLSKATRTALGLESDSEEAEKTKKNVGHEDSDEFDFFDS